MSGETIAGAPSADPRVTDAGPTTSHRIQAAVAWIAWFIAVVSGTLGAVLVATDQATGHPVLEQTPVSGIAGTAIAVGYGSVGLLLVLRRPGLVIGWLFVAIGVVAGLSNYAWGYVGLGLTEGTAPGPFSVVEVAWLNNTLTYATWASLSFLLVLLFPDGRPLGPPWRLVVFAAVGVLVVLAVGLAFEPGPLRLFETIENPTPGARTARGGGRGDGRGRSHRSHRRRRAVRLEPCPPLSTGGVDRTAPAPVVRLGIGAHPGGRDRPGHHGARRYGGVAAHRPELGHLRVRRDHASRSPPSSRSCESGSTTSTG